MVDTTLEAYGLDIYIKQEVPEPEERNAKRRWKKERAAVNLIIGATLIEPPIYYILIGQGWSLEEKNPKCTYDKVCRAVRHVPDHMLTVLLDEFKTIDCQTFESFDKFCERLVQLKRQLEYAGKINERSALRTALKSIRKSYETQYETWEDLLDEADLTWTKLMEDFHRLPNRIPS